MENLSASIAIIAYVLSIAFLAPDFMRLIIELGVRAYVPFYGINFSVFILRSLPILGSIIIAILLNIQHGTADRPLAVAAIFASIGFLISYYIQAKGFSYQLLPATVFAAIGVATISFKLSPRETKTLLLRKISLVTLIFAINIHGQFYPTTAPLFEKIIAENSPSSHTIFIATTNVSKAFPLVNRNNFIWASSFPAQWLTPYVATKWTSGPLPEDGIVRHDLDWTVTDLIQFKPDIVIIDISNRQDYVPKGTFNYLAFWNMDVRFPKFWQDYTLKSIQYDYAIYSRNLPQDSKI